MMFTVILRHTYKPALLVVVVVDGLVPATCVPVTSASREIRPPAISAGLWLMTPPSHSSCFSAVCGAQQEAW